MKNKALIIGCCIVVVALLVGCYFMFLRPKDSYTPKTYTIKEWHNYAQTVTYEIIEKDIISGTEGSEKDNDGNALTGGEYSTFTVKGLKSGSSIVSVKITSPDETVESKLYYFTVNDKLDVEMTEVRQPKY